MRLHSSTIMLGVGLSSINHTHTLNVTLKVMEGLGMCLVILQYESCNTLKLIALIHCCLKAYEDVG